MWKILKNRIKQGHRTCGYPKENPVFPERFRGRPILQTPETGPSFENPDQNSTDVTGALSIQEGPTLDMGKLLFNEKLKQALPPNALDYSTDHRMAVTKREDLILKPGELKLASSLDKKIKKLFGRSLKLRAVCAGSCNGCDSELQVTGITVFDLNRFGIQFVASPRHADGLIVTGPVTQNMQEALLKTYEAVADPKIVIAVGSCALSGGPFAGSPEVKNGVESLLPVDLYVPGCPPHPLTILDGLLRLLGRLEKI